MYQMFLKVHRGSDNSEVVAVCDRELLNTTLKDGDFTLEISENFYGNTLIEECEVRRILASACNANLIGHRTIALAIDTGVLDREACTEIGGVPHAIILAL